MWFRRLISSLWNYCRLHDNRTHRTLWCRGTPWRHRWRVVFFFQHLHPNSEKNLSYKADWQSPGRAWPQSRRESGERAPPSGLGSKVQRDKRIYIYLYAGQGWNRDMLQRNATFFMFKGIVCRKILNKKKHWIIKKFNRKYTIVTAPIREKIK